MKKALLIVFILIMVLTSCESTSENSNETKSLIKAENIEQNEQVKTAAPHAWKIQNLEIPDGCNVRENGVSAYNVHYDKENNVFRIIYHEELAYTPYVITMYELLAYQIATYAIDGTLLETHRIEVTEERQIYDVCLYDDGYYVRLTDENGKNQIITYNWEHEQTDVLIVDDKYPSGKTINHTDGLTYVLSGGVTAFDKNGREVYSWRPVTNFMADIFVHNGVMYFMDRFNNLYVPEIESQSAAAPDYPDIPDNLKGTIFAEKPIGAWIFGEFSGSYSKSYNYRTFGEDYDIYYVNKEGVYGSNYLSTEDVPDAECLLRYSSSGMTYSMIDIIKILDSEHILAMVGELFPQDDRPGKGKLQMLVYDHEAAKVEEKSLTLAYVGGLDNVTQAAISYFNMINTEYRIDLFNYGQYNKDDAPNGGIDRLELDFASGKYPDILMLNDDMDSVNYTRKGIFQNLYDLGFDTSKLANSVRTAAEYDGGLYSLPMTFSFTALLNREGIESLTLEELYKLYEQYGEMTMPQFDREYLIKCMIGGGVLSEYIDYYGASCNFNNAEFIRLLEFWREYNVKPDVKIRPTNAAYRLAPENQQLVKGGESLFHAATDYGTSTLLSFSCLYDGYNYSYTGFPVSSGFSGVRINPGNAFAITTACAYPEAALELIEFLFDSDISETYLWDGNFGSTVRSNTDILRRMLEKAYIDDISKRLCYDIKRNTTSVITIITEEEKAAYEVPIPPFTMTQDEFDNDPNIIPINVTKAEIDGFFEGIVNIKARGADDPLMIDILWDELIPFFAGQDTASNTANRIDSRVGIYLAERYG